MVKILCSLILDFHSVEKLCFSWCLKNGTSVSYKILVSWIFWLCQMQLVLFVSLTLAVAVLSLSVLFIVIRLTSRGEKGHLLVELKLKTYQRHAYLICQCQRRALKLPKIIMMFLEGQPCWTTAILFTPFWMNKWLHVGEMTTYVHIILQSGSEWEHRSLQTSFPAAQLDKTVFFFLFFHTWYKKSTSLLKC